MIGNIIQLKIDTKPTIQTIQEWSDFMKTSSTWNFRFIVGKIMVGLVLAAMISGIEAVPALGEEDHKRVEKHDKGRNEHKGRGYDRDRYAHGRRDYHPDYYTPPPVIYAPPPQPGITIFFPPIVIR
jgi:hypothetical protein